MKPLHWLALAFCVGISAAASAATEPPRVDVILWFDTEDYLSPADDDACKRLAEMLTERHIRATFKVVGEKARVLERRGRHDVIEALKKHDIGYHANFHSVHPAPTEYLADCGLLDGMAEFVRREGGGAADVRRIFAKDTLVCYGQPGSSWAPQALAALKSIGVAPAGIPCYVDEGEHVGLDHQPFWYEGVLNVFNMGPNYTRMELHDPAAVEPAKQKVSEIANRLQSKGGGLISIFYHPCEWIHLEFWDGVNFRRGANPPPEHWKAPPQQAPAETEAAFARFAQYIDYIRSIPGVRFITAGQLPSVYPDLVRSEGASESDLTRMAAGLSSCATNGLDFVTIGNRSYSVADQFELLARSVGQVIGGQRMAFPARTAGLLGPDNDPPSAQNERTHLDWPAFRMAATDVANFVQAQGRVPARVFIGPDPISPAVFLVGLGEVYAYYHEHGALPVETGVDLPTATELLPARHVAADTPGLFGGWIIHKEGFRAPKLLKLARLQAWTLKPAIRCQN